jgi:ClpP class serine protease
VEGKEKKTLTETVNRKKKIGGKMGIGNLNKIVAGFNTPWAILPDNLEAMALYLQNRLGDSSLPIETIQSISSPDSAYSPYSVTRTREFGVENIKPGVYKLDIEGALIPRASGFDAMCGMMGSNQIVELLSTIHTLPNISALVLSISSPGGTVTGTPELAHAISELPSLGVNTIAYVDEMACSAAYWIASSCETIVASPTAMLGSIGVRMTRVETKESKVKKHHFSAGGQKLWGDPSTELSMEEASHYQTLVDNCYSMFVEGVLDGRINSISGKAGGNNLTEAKIKETQAGVYFAKDAPDWMCDYIMSYRDFMNSL